MKKINTAFTQTARICAGYPRVKRVTTDATKLAEAEASAKGARAISSQSESDDPYRQWAERFWSTFYAYVGNLWAVTDGEITEPPEPKYVQLKQVVLAAFGKRLWMLDTLKIHAELSVDRLGAVWVARFAGILFTAGIQDDKSLNKFASCVLAGIKVARARSNDNEGNSKTRWSSQTRRFVELFGTIVSQIADEGKQAWWRRYVRHYEVMVCQKESDLANAFSQGRLEYNNHREDPEVRIGYAWLLHDCFNFALKKHPDEQIVKLFSSEIEALPKTDLPSDKDSDIGHLLTKDLKRAARFLSGAEAAENLVAQGSPEKAMAAYREAIAKDPTNLEARVGLVRLGAMIKDFSGFDEEFLKLMAQPVVMLESQNKSSRVSAISLVSAVTDYLNQLLSSPDLIKNISLQLGNPNGKPKIYNGWRAFADVLSLVYIDFVRCMVHELDDGSRRIFTTPSGKKTPSLSERICRCLHQCAVVNGCTENPWLVDEDTGKTAIRDLTFVCEFIEKELSGAEWIKDGCQMYGAALLAAKNYEKARKVFTQSLQGNPSSPSAWIGLGRSFPEDSTEWASCMCKALALDGQGRSAHKAHENLGRFYGKIGRLADAAREFAEADKLRRRHGWKSRNVVVIQPSQQLKVVKPAVRNEHEFKDFVEHANTLVEISCNRVQGVVVTVRGHKKKDFRVFWNDAAAQTSGYYAFVKDDIFGEVPVTVGMPIALFVANRDNQQDVVSVETRLDGSPWDVYPREIGIVVAVDANRGFATLALNGGKCVMVPMDLIGENVTVVIGQMYDVGLLQVESGSKVLFCLPAGPEVTRPDFVREFSGVFKRKHRSCLFGRVGDVFIPKELCVKIGSEDEEVRGLAVQVATARSRGAGWQAIAIEKPFKEVDSVLRS